MAAPSHANLIVTIGGRNITISHKNFSSLKIKRKAGDVCNNFTLQILDEDTFEIEAMVLAGNSEIKIVILGDSNEVIKDFYGSILKMDNTFVDDRVMLTLEGFVGLNSRDKFEVRTINWNVVPKFNWSDIFSDADQFDESIADQIDLEENGSWWDKFCNGLSKVFKSGWSGFKSTILSLFSGNSAGDMVKNWLTMSIPGGMLIRSLYEGAQQYYDENPQKIMTLALTHDYGTEDDYKYNPYFGKDSQGYFFTSQKYWEEFEERVTDAVNDVKKYYRLDEDCLDSNEPTKIYADGEYIIPMNPGKIISSIATGKPFTYLLESDFKNYRGTSFYDGYQHNKDGSTVEDEDGEEVENEEVASTSTLDWLFINLWFKARKNVPSAGWEIGEIDEDLWLVEDNLAQTKKSYTDYINSVLLEKSIKVKQYLSDHRSESGHSGGGHSSGGGAHDSDTWESRAVDDRTEYYANYRFYADESGKVYFKRFNASEADTTAVKETYILYGNPVGIIKGGISVGHSGSTHTSGGGRHDNGTNSEALNNTTSNSASGKNGFMTNFNANLNILTAMITGGTGDSSAGDISTMNIITGGTTEVTVSQSTKFSEGESYVPDWGVIRFVPNFNTINSQSDISTTLDRAMSMTYKATCTIEGNHNLSPQDFIDIIIIPKSTGIRHHTSGRYYILSIDETIQDGRRVSTFDLVKNISRLDSTRVVEYNESIGSMSDIIVKENDNYTIYGDGHVEYKDYKNINRGKHG